MASMAGRVKIVPSVLGDIAIQVDTGVRGAADVLSFGLADEATAAANASLGQGGPGNWQHRYQAELEQERQRDAYDARFRRPAHLTGQAAGYGLLFTSGAGQGRAYSSALKPGQKGKLGEAMSEVKTVLMGDLPIARQVRVPLQKSYTVADQTTARGKIVESKFGPTAELSPNQRRAAVEFAPIYRVDRWLPKHVGRVTGSALSGGGLFGQMWDDRTKD